MATKAMPDVGFKFSVPVMTSPALSTLVLSVDVTPVSPEPSPVKLPVKLFKGLVNVRAFA